MSFVGTPYRWGGDDPIKGFDCSGLVQELLLAGGVHPDPKVDHTAQMLFNAFDQGQWNRYTIGALVWYGQSATKITHVAWLLDSKSCITASGGGSKTLTLDDAADQNGFIKVRPIDYRSDRVAVIWPRYPGFF